MPTYFNLHWPKSERLMGENQSYANREDTECPITTEHIDGSRRVGPLSVRLAHNLRDETMIWCWIEGLVIHRRLLTEFEQHRLTGFRTQPAAVRFSDNSISNDYLEFVVTGWAGLARQESGIQLRDSCPACHWKKYSGIANYEKLIDWDQWTGDDFFIVWPMPKFILMTERAAMLLLENAVKSFTLGALDDVDPPVGRSGFTVGRLSSYLPEDLAIKYGSEHGLE